MSIYATIMEFGVKRFDDEDYLRIFVQAVPPHIIQVGPAWDFLPPPVEPEGRIFRAVLFVVAGDPKGTARSGQEYPQPLLQLTGREYHDIRFADLMMRLEEALDARYGCAAWKSIIDPKERRWYVE
jgi:hypothetical protein